MADEKKIFLAYVYRSLNILYTYLYKMDGHHTIDGIVGHHEDQGDELERAGRSACAQNRLSQRMCTLHGRSSFLWQFSDCFLCGAPVFLRSASKKGASRLLSFSVAVLTVALKALAAVDGLVATGLDGHLRRAAAAIADDFVHLALRTAAAVLGATRRTAAGATARLVLEALLRIERLLGSGENKFGAALAAGQRLVLVHESNLPKNLCLTRRQTLMCSRRTSGHRTKR